MRQSKSGFELFYNYFGWFVDFHLLLRYIKSNLKKVLFFLTSTYTYSFVLEWFMRVRS